MRTPGSAPAFLSWKGARHAKRRRFKQTVSLQERLLAFANELREKAAVTPAGPERDDLLNRASQADGALDLCVQTALRPKGSEP